MRLWHLTLLALVVSLTTGVGLSAARAQEQPVKPAPNSGDPTAGDRIVKDPRTIWPVGLSRIAGSYKFDQIASPGGLWDSVKEPNGMYRRSQIAITHLPPKVRQTLEQAEIVIRDLQPSVAEAVERDSPSKRGMLRYYNETALGTLQLKNLPGIGGKYGDNGSYSGPVQFVLEHQSHSNPSPSGVFQQRQFQERTWGAATLDFAELIALPMRPEELQKPERKPDQKPKPEAEEDEQHAEEAQPVIGNARVMRSGVEIYAFVEVTHTDETGEHSYIGSIRMLRQGIPTAQPPGTPVPVRPMPPVPQRML